MTTSDRPRSARGGHRGTAPGQGQHVIEDETRCSHGRQPRARHSGSSTPMSSSSTNAPSTQALSRRRPSCTKPTRSYARTAASLSSQHLQLHPVQAAHPERVLEQHPAGVAAPAAAARVRAERDAEVARAGQRVDAPQRDAAGQRALGLDGERHVLGGRLPALAVVVPGQRLGGGAGAPTAPPTSGPRWRARPPTRAAAPTSARSMPRRTTARPRSTPPRQAPKPGRRLLTPAGSL